MADRRFADPRPWAVRPPLAAVSFVGGLVGLLVANLLLGPLAIVTGSAALQRDADRRGRAALGIALGCLDIAVFVLLAVRSDTRHGGLDWNFFKV